MTQEPVITSHTLSNGLKAVHRLFPGMTEYCGVAVNAGSRDETPDRHGLAHFVEHTIFKGTSTHSAGYILNRMETVGGELNAYTTKEETMVYAAMPTGNCDRATRLIADLVSRSQFPLRELDKEREVVADEIDSYLDSPGELVFDLFEDKIYDGNPLGHNILGTKESINTFTPEICRQWIDSHYSADNMAAFYLGPMPADRFFRLAERHFGPIKASGSHRMRHTPKESQPFTVVRDMHSHQSHTVIGAQVPGMFSDMRWALALLTNIIGGPGMNSRLNVALREKRGLVYTVDATTSLMTDTGLTTIYFGCDPDDTNRCLKLIARELSRLADTALSPRQLDAAKRQYLGQLALSGDNKEQTALNMARATLYYGRTALPGETAERISAVTACQLREAAAIIASAMNRRLTIV